MINRPSSLLRKCPFHSAVRKYGVEAFRKYILSFYDTYQEAVDEEKYIVNEAWVKSKSNYNVALGGNGYLNAGYTKDQISGFYSGRKNHRYGRPAHNRKRVLQYSLSGELIGTYESASDAGRAVGDFGSNISSCCRGEYGQVNGFVFRYEKYDDEHKALLEKNLAERHREYNQDGSWKMSKEYRAERARLAKGRAPNFVFTEDIRAKMAAAKLGKKRNPHSEETKRKIGAANKLVHLKKIGGAA